MKVIKKFEKFNPPQKELDLISEILENEDLEFTISYRDHVIHFPDTPIGVGPRVIIPTITNDKHNQNKNPFFMELYQCGYNRNPTLIQYLIQTNPVIKRISQLTRYHLVYMSKKYDSINDFSVILDFSRLGFKD